MARTNHCVRFDRWNRHDIRAALGDAAYDSDALRQFLTDRSTTPVIKPKTTRKQRLPFDQDAYKGRNIIERALSHLKDWRRVATSYDKLGRNYRATVILASIMRWWA
jgi:transposase